MMFFIHCQVLIEVNGKVIFLKKQGEHDTVASVLF